MGIAEVRHPLEEHSAGRPWLHDDLQDLAPDLPAGPLDAYRQQASFNWKQLRVTLEDPDVLRVKVSQPQTNTTLKIRKRKKNKLFV